MGEFSDMRLWRPVAVGVVAILLFFGFVGGWAVLAPLNSAAIAPGLITVDSNRKTVQHLEGGIVKRILVRDGDRVRAGQPLVVLDETQRRATLDLVRGRLIEALLLEARLIAERDGAEIIHMPDELRDRAEDRDVLETLDGQRRILKARRDSLENSTRIMRQSIAQFGEEVRGLEGQIAAEDRQLALIGEELTAVRDLARKGLAKKPRVLALQREMAEIEGSRARNVSAIARARQAIIETRLRIDELRTRRVNEVEAQLRDAQAELFGLAERYRAAEDVLSRTAIVAPLDGVIVNLQVHTPGGVISPGAALLDIVPSGDALVVDARIDPNDIDVVRPGLTAQVRLGAFSQRRFAPLEGTVTWVSADGLTDEQTGRAFYRCRIALEDGYEAKLDGNALTPGMQAEVLVITGERTPFDYLMAPLHASFTRAFREQ